MPLSEVTKKALKNRKELRLTGWGWTHKFKKINNISTTPMETSVFYIDPNQCAQRRSPPAASHQLCSDEGDTKDWYRGHAGGPLFSVEYVEDVPRFLQFGVVSVGKLTWREDEPAVHTNVSSFIRWIAFKIGTF